MKNEPAWTPGVLPGLVRRLETPLVKKGLVALILAFFSVTQASIL
jgi:hypothetical protein